MKKIQKRVYTSPSIKVVNLDNEISLQLASVPPVPDSGDEVYNTADYFNNDPYKIV